MTKTEKANPMELMLADPAQPMDHRVDLLRMLAQDSSPAARAALASLLGRLEGKSAEKVHEEKARQLTEMIRALEEGPRRNGVFVEFLDPKDPVRRASVILDDGTRAYTPVPDEFLAAGLRRGDLLVLDGKGRAVLGRGSSRLRVGEVCPLERVVDDWHVEASGRGGERRVLLAGEELMEAIRAGRVEPGASLVASERQFVALSVLAPQDGLAHFRYLVRSGPPDVVVERDLGCPPAVIAELEEMVRIEMTRPELRRRFRLPRCVSRLLAGATGSGKSFAIDALWRRLYEVMSEVTGVAVDQLPPRLIRISASDVLTKWYGESDRNIARSVREAIQLARRPWRAPDGREFILPCLFVIEEIDSLAGARGRDSIHDRVTGTLLQHLDPGRPEVAGSFIIFLGTTNVASQVDPAFLRRIGSRVESFGRLNQRSFKAVLAKRIRGLPIAADNGTPQEQLERSLVDDLTAWLFSPNSPDPGVVELVYAGQTTPVIKHRRDFFTAAVVDRAVREAAEAAVAVEARGGRSGLSLAGLMHAFDNQVRSLTDQINEQTAGNFVDLPDGVRVATLRRVPPPEFLPIDLQLP